MNKKQAVVPIERAALPHESGRLSSGSRPPAPAAPSSKTSTPRQDFGVTMQRSVEEQSLALKVMRLYKPKAKEPGIHLGLHALDMRNWTHGEAGQLLLPGSFGNIYIGQVFSCYISVCNNGKCDEIHNVAIHVELETTSNKTALFDKREQAKDLAGSTYGKTAVARPGDMVELNIEHELSSIGLHTLRVTVHFDTAVAHGRRSIRKHYKFEVAKPLSFAATFEPLGNATGPISSAGTQSLLAQVAVTNQTDSGMLLAQVDMLPTHEGFQATPLAPEPTSTQYRKPAFLPPKESRNYVFRLDPRRDRSSTDSLLLPGTYVARVLTRWSIDFAEAGRLRSQPLSWKVGIDRQQGNSVVIVLKDPPSSVIVGVPTSIRLQLTSLGSHAFAQAKLCIGAKQGADGSGLLVVGRTVVSLGRLESNETRVFDCVVVALSPGLHELADIQLKDAHSGEVFAGGAPPALLATRQVEKL